LPKLGCSRRELPCEVPSTGYGDRLVAMVRWLSGEHRQSHRMVKSLMATLFSMELSRGSINRLRRQVSEAVEEPVEQAQQYVQIECKKITEILYFYMKNLSHKLHFIFIGIDKSIYSNE
jgi:hypothetical protein